ncbi:MAG TPA: cation diffusion facilitator family transporter [Gemmataceae bacterium]|nr:cation diffusion facilitator family transporter [Gemmataceae bacterium]
MAHAHSRLVTGRFVGVSIVLTTLFVAAEAIAGYWSNSLALLSDAGHNFADALALVFTWYAVRASRWPADAKRTFGYHRAGILAALINAGSLVLIALFIFWEAVRRLNSPEPVQGGLMIGVALAAVLLNGLISVWLRAEGKHDLNIRSAYLHMLGDALSAVGVVIAGVIVIATGQTIADPLVSLLIGVLILWSSWGILTEAVNVLLEAVPKGLDVAKVVQSVCQVPGVLDVHDLHVWTVTSGMTACSLHIRVVEQSALEGQRIQQAVAAMLEHDFRIAHSTIQVEVETCGVNDLHCDMQAVAQDELPDDSHSDHQQ